jgi:hypothetical protein
MYGVPIKRGQIRRLVRAEHGEWHKPRTWLEGDGPQFAATRGPSSGCTASTHLAAWTILNRRAIRAGTAYARAAPVPVRLGC